MSPTTGSERRGEILGEPLSLPCRENPGGLSWLEIRVPVDLPVLWKYFLYLSLHWQSQWHTTLKLIRDKPRGDEIVR